MTYALKLKRKQIKLPIMTKYFVTGHLVSTGKPLRGMPG